MARPQKIGLDYFPLNVDIDQDDKVAIIEAQHGILGFTIAIKLLMKIYSEGYYYDWTEKEQLLFSKRVNVDINDVNVVVNDSVKWGLFDKRMFNKYQILTSRGIQMRYFEAVKRRQRVEVAKEFLLLDNESINDYNNLFIVSINDDINEVNVNINPQSKVKESKVKESKNHNLESENPTEPEKPKEPSPQQVIFKHWNSKEIIQHRNLTDKLKRSINGALRDYSQDEICTAIDNYAVILTNEKYYWSYKWGLKDFLIRGLDKFLDFETASNNYLVSKNPRGEPKKHKHQDFNQREYIDSGDFFSNMGDSL